MKIVLEMKTERAYYKSRSYIFRGLKTKYKWQILFDPESCNKGATIRFLWGIVIHVYLFFSKTKPENLLLNYFF